VYVIDDPNLRWPTYGYMDYAEIAYSARQYGYHLSVAMVPLDGRLFHRGAVQLFQEHASHLSLCTHGNDHLRDELSRPRSFAEGTLPAAQAIQRSLAFERRTGLEVDRVMVAPHEALGEAATQALLACGFEAFCSTRPYPWLDFGHDLSWLSRPSEAGPLIGWHPMQLVGDGLPALLRLDFDHPREELVYRAFLGQPLIMYGHDDLLRGGTAQLEEAATELAQLGDIRWQSLGSIAQSSYLHRRNGSTMEVRMFGRRIRLAVPDGVTDVLVDAGALRRSATRMSIVGARSEFVSRDPMVMRLEVDGPTEVELRLEPQLDPLSVDVPLPSVKSIIRRIASESRDRARSMLFS
jgi:hypothetical protein